MMEVKDISIGEDKWIKWIELDFNDKNIFEIDYVLEPLEVFWQRLEIECVAECCGIDAFSFWPEDIMRAAEQFDRNDLKRKLFKIRDEIVQSKSEIVSSIRLNNLVNKGVFIKLIEHIINNL